MHKLALALMIWVLASTANAGGADSSSGLQCGVNFGGKYVAYNSGSETKDKKDSRLNHVAGAVRAEPVRFATASAADAQSTESGTVEVQLPRKLTIATFGCAWL